VERGQADHAAAGAAAQCASDLCTAGRQENGEDALGRPEDAARAWNLETADADGLHFMEGRPSIEDPRGLWPAMLAEPFSLAPARGF